MSTASILARLARLEKALNLEEPEDDGAGERVRRMLETMATNMRAAPGWKELPPDPSGGRLRALIEAARAAKAKAEPA
jgi:hypothetical protein